MKEGIHPNYREVCFLDLSNNFQFVTRSCAPTKETIKLDDGRELPLYKLDTSSESHPFYTGTQKSVQHGRPRGEIPQPLWPHQQVMPLAHGASKKAAHGLLFFRTCGAANDGSLG